MNLWVIFFAIVVASAFILWALAGIERDFHMERGTAELTEEDRNLLKRHIRALEANTTAQRKGRP